MATKTSEDPPVSLVTSTTPGDGRRRRQATKKTKGVDGLPPCLICGEPASGLHYGVNSCSACKAFFFRNWMRRDHLVCEGDGNCLSIPGSGLGCPACRMKRCLKAGMSLTGTRRGRYTHETRVKIKRDAKKMLGDETIKASVNSSYRNSNCPSDDFFQTNISSSVPDKDGVTRIAPMDRSDSQERDLHNFVSYQKEWGMPTVKIEEITDENEQFYEDLSLQPLDLSKGELNTSEADIAESVGSNSYTFPEITDVSTTKLNTCNARGDEYSTPSQSCFNQNVEEIANPVTYETTSFLSLMNMDSDESNMSTRTEPEDLSKDYNSAPELNLPAPINTDTSNVRNLTSNSLQVMQPSMLNTNSQDKDEEDDYTKLQNIICLILSTPKQGRMKLKAIAESVTCRYKYHDQYPEGFFKSVGNIQRNFLEQKALQKTVFGDMKPIPQEEYLRIYYTTGLDIDGRRALVEKNKTRYEQWYHKYIKFAKSLPYFQDLPVQDQISILKAAKSQYVSLCDYQAFDEDRLLYTDNNGDTYDIDDFSKVFSKEYISVMADFVRALKSLRLTEDERNVMKSICLFTPDYCVTEAGKEKAKEQYVKLINVLAYLLIENHGDDPSFQYRLLQARELSKIFSVMDTNEKWKAFRLYAEDQGSVPIATELYCPTKKGADLVNN